MANWQTMLLTPTAAVRFRIKNLPKASGLWHDIEKSQRPGSRLLLPFRFYRATTISVIVQSEGFGEVPNPARSTQ